MLLSIFLDLIYTNINKIFDMKKFSKEIGVKVGVEPKVSVNNVKRKELDIKNAVNAMMNEFIHIRLEGNHDPMFMQNVYIGGKEHFLDAMCQYIENRMIKENKTTLEEARGKVFEKDLSWIDTRIDILESQSNQFNIEDMTVKNMLLNESKNNIVVEKKMEVIDFVIPQWAVSALINGDESGLDEEDQKSLDSFVAYVIKEYGNANFSLPSDDELELGFRHSNNINSYGTDCVKLLLMVEK
jgi:hypothetical protein